MLTILFRDNNPIPATVDLGGAVIQPAHVELVFWGSAYSGATTPSIAAVTSAVNGVLGTAATPGPYTSALSQYRSGLGPANVVGSVTVTTSSPNANFTNAQVNAFLTAAINAGTLPSPASDSQLLYMVITQPGSTDPTEGLGGEHSNGSSTFGAFKYGWTRNNGTLDDVTYFFSHELVEAITDPGGTTIQVQPSNPSSWNEVSDLSAQSFSYRLGGTLVQSYLSNLDRAYIVPTGQTQNFTVENGVLKVNGDQKPANLNDAITIGLDASGNLQATLNGETATFDAGVIKGLDISGGDGDDSLTIDFTNGNPIPAGQLAYHGGLGNNTLKMQGGTETAESYTPGLDNSSGRIDITVGGTARSITFENLAPIVDLVAGPLVVNGTAANNAINYTQGSVTANGLVTVDNFESIEFSNKTTLTINGQAGDDNINLNNPTTPTGLTGITVNGGDPTASDNLIVNGIAGTLDNLRLTPTNVGAGTVINDTAAQPNVTFSNIEHVDLVVQSVDGDGIRIDGTAGNDQFVYAPGSTVDSGTFTGTMDQNNATTKGPFAFVPTTFHGVLSGSNDIDVNFFNSPGGTDNLVYYGTAGDDALAVQSGQAGGTDIKNTINGIITGELEIFNIASATVAALAGNDTVTVSSPAGPAAVVLTVQGGDSDPNSSDTLNYSTSGDATISLGAGTITSAGNNTVNFSGFEKINETSAGGGALTINGTTGNDNFFYTPTGATAGTVTGVGPIVTFTGVSSTFTLDPLAGNDTVTVNGTTGNDNISVIRGATTLVTSSNKAVSLPSANTEALHIAAGDGNDAIAVSGTGGPASIVVDGGANTSTGGVTDNLVIINSTAGTSTVTPGATSDAGIVTTPDGSVTFTTIEGVVITGANAADTLTIAGTTGPDTFTLLISGANQALVNNRAFVTFSSFGTVNLNGGSGDDVFSVTPGNLVGVTTINVNGGDPTASDTLVVNGTTATDIVGYNPTNFDSGSVTITGQPTTNFTGVEQVTYSGAGNTTDILTLTTPAFSHTITYTPGATASTGRFDIQDGVTAFAPFTIKQVSLVTLANTGGAREDTFELLGTARDDVFTINATNAFVNLLGAGTATPVFTTTGISRMTARGLEGDDRFDVTGTLPFSTGGVFIDGGDPSASDVLNLSLPTAAVTDNLETQIVTGYGADVTYTGVEVVNLNGNTDGGSQPITIFGTSGADSMAYTPTGANTGTVTRATQNVTTNFNTPGLFTIDAASGSDTVTVNGTAGDDTIALVRAATTTVQVGAFKLVNLPAANTEALRIAAGDGNDTTNITGTAGPAFVGVDSGANAGNDTITVTNTTAGTTTVTPGASSDSGSISTPDGNIVFTTTERITITGANATDTITAAGTNAPDNIALQFLGGANRFWVNNQAVVSFSSFGTVNLNGAFGDDLFSVTPSGLVGVTTINVNGGDPTASDKLIVTGTSASDTIGYNPTGVGAGNVTITGSPVTNFTNTELVTIDGNGGADPLTVTTPAGVDFITYTPGDAPDAGNIAVRVAGGVALVPLTFLHLGATGTTTLANSGGARADLLEMNGTVNSDTFNVSGDSIQVLGLNSASVTRPLSATGVNSAVFRGWAGDDIFNINGNIAFAGGVTVDGDEPSASDVLNFTGTGTSPVTLDYAANTITQTGAPAVTYVGIELANINAGAQNFTANGTTGNDSLTVTPTGAAAATLRMTSNSPSLGSVPVVNASNIGTTFTVDLLAGSDNLAVQGTQAGETITATATTVAITSLKTVTYANTENLQLYGLAGNDTFDITPSTSTTMFVDGGDPIGSTPGDQLIVHPPGAFSPEAGPENDEGGVKFGGGFQRLSWDHIEGVTFMGGGPVLILGTNADDDITIIARDSSTHAGTDGVQDFTVSVNTGPDWLFINESQLFVDALAGDDDIVVHEPAPNNAVWNVQITLAGGTPAVADGPLGDSLELETPGTQTVIYTPTGIDTGTLNDTTNTSVITMGSFTLPALSYISSPGGIERVDYQGLGGGDSLTVVGTAGSDTFTHTPGERGDDGRMVVNKLLPINYTGLGAAGSVTANGNGGADNVLVYQGTANPDIFQVDTNGAVVLSTGAVTHIPVKQQVSGTSTINHLEIHALGGVNTFNVTGPLPYNSTFLDGGLGSSFDPTNLSGASTAVVVNLADSTLGTDTTVTGYGGVISLAGTDVANLDVNNQTLKVNGTSQDDTIVYKPSGAAAGTFTNTGLATVFNFTNATSTFTIAGGSGGLADTVEIDGTNTRDTIQISQPSRTAQVITGGVFTKTVTLDNTIDTLTAKGLRGQDTFQVVPGPGVNGQTRDNLLVNVDGGADSGEIDALVVAATGGATLPATTFVTVNRGQDLTSGTVRVFESAVADPDINYINVETVTPNVAGTNLNPNLLIMGPDTGEPNNFLGNATFLGSGPNLQVYHASVFPSSTEFPGVPNDFDYYRVVADKTGTLDFQVYFKVFSTALLPNGGALDVAVFDGAGNLIGSAGSSIAEVFGSVGANGNARVRIPAVQGQTYYLGVTGSTNDNQSISVNGYDVTVINTPAQTPANLELSRSTTGITGAAGVPDTGDLPATASPDDTGRSQFDNVTKTNNPTIFLRLDDAFFLQDLPGNQTTGGVPGMGTVTIPFNNSTSLTSTAAGFRIALYDGGNGAPAAGNAHTLDANDSTFIGFAQPVAGVPHLYSLKIGSQGADSLADGLHNITARVQMIDPQLAATPTARGFGDRSAALQVTIDTVVPPVFFGPTEGANGNGLDPSSDSGVVGQPGTFTDKITNVTAPDFFGTAEADAIIRVYADLDGNPNTTGDQTLLGKTVAIPLDGTNAFPRGQWNLHSLVDLNNPAIFPKDGIRHILATAEDLAGNVSAPVAFDILIDTSGPQVTNVSIGGHPGYNLFGLKPNNADQGPTPLTSSLVINVEDFPNFTNAFPTRDVAFIAAIAETPGVYVVKGDHVGIVSIDHIDALLNGGVDGQPLTGTITLVFSKPLPDDRYTLTILDTGIIDLAGNKLDGESNAAEPNGAPNFPSGDGQPGSNFIARFTIDTRPELAAYAAASISADINGDQVWDPYGRNNDASNIDLQFTLQIAPAIQGAVSPMNVHDSVFVGNWGGRPNGERGSVTNGFDKLASYGMDNLIGSFRWLIDVDGDGIIDPADGDIVSIQPAGFQINGQPIAGEFDGNTTDGAEIGLFDGQFWWLDTNHDFVIDQTDVNNGGKIATRIAGYPIVGDFDGNGFTDLATWKDNKFFFEMASALRTYNGAVQSINFGFPGVNEKPIAADMDHDGITDVGLWVPGRTTTVPQDYSQWYFLISNDFTRDETTNEVIPADHGQFAGTVDALNHPFSPSPLGNDLYAEIFDEFALPLVGNFDPPTVTRNAAATPPNNSLGSVLKHVESTVTTTTGDQIYSFKNLRDATATINLTGGSTGVTMTVYDAGLNALASSTSGAPIHISASAGQTLLVKVHGATGPTSVGVTNSVDDSDLLDVSRDHLVSALDALQVINFLNSHGSSDNSSLSSDRVYLDTSMDGIVSALDALRVINHLNAIAGGTQSGTGLTPLALEISSADSAAASDAVFAALAVMDSGKKSDDKDDLFG